MDLSGLGGSTVLREVKTNILHGVKLQNKKIWAFGLRDHNKLEEVRCKHL